MKTKIILGAAFVALAATAPAVLQAQQLPAPVIAVVNTDQIFGTCTQCAAANTQLQAQANQLQQRVQALQTQIQTEGNAIEPLIRALNGAQPDAALTTRIQNFQTMQQNAEREIAASRERIQRNVNFVRQQIGQRVQPAIATVQQQRGATIVVDTSQVLASSPALDITPAVLAIVNQNATPLNVNAPQQAAPARPGTPTPPAPAQPNRPRPQGR
ncbi:MAG TPA: OmpH family outer membrane protein [Allosphingosinicella sp.]|nr:OmpH family outer membrane protein [Allosphingosinicella sp.]